MVRIIIFSLVLVLVSPFMAPGKTTDRKISGSVFITKLSELFIPDGNSESFFQNNSVMEADSLPLESVSGDTLFCRSDKKIVCKVIDLETDYVAFSLKGNPEDIIMMAASEVISIHFENGFIEDLSLFRTSQSNADLFQRGVQDGLKFYNGKADFRRGILDGVMTYLFYSGLVMLVIDIRKDPIIYPDYENPLQAKRLLDNNYRLGYSNSARDIKKRKLIGGYFTGLLGLPVVFTGLAIGLFLATVP